MLGLENGLPDLSGLANGMRDRLRTIDVFAKLKGGQQDNRMRVIRRADDESVEVLRGPQGTLYGRNASAGTIRLSARKPADTLQMCGHEQRGRLASVWGLLGRV